MSSQEKEAHFCNFWRCKERITSIFSHIPIAWRITGWYSIFLLLMLFLLALFTIKFMSIWEEYQIRNDLRLEVTHISKGSTIQHNIHNDVYTLIYTQDGLVSRGYGPDGFPQDSPLSEGKVSEVRNGNRLYYYTDAPYESSNFSGWVRGIVPSAVIHRHVNSVILALLAGGLSFIFLATLGGYILIHLGLKPIRKMTKTAEEIGKRRDLSKRIDPSAGNDEISQLSETFNFMLSSLEKSNQRERQFSSDVSHELRTPIAVIQAESDYGRKYIENIEEAKESFENIFKQCKNMTSIVTQLLELARLDNLDSVDITEINLSDLVNELILDYKPLWMQQNILMILNINENIIVRGNYILLRRAIANLLDNAMKFTKSNITIDLYYNDAKRPEVDISDNGPGIEKAELQKIWYRLYQVEESRNHFNNKGFGLGLYFVSNVVKLHGGYTKVISEPNVKTTFGIIL